MSKRTIALCACGCGRVGEIVGRGLVQACYMRAKRKGVLSGFPRGKMGRRRTTAPCRICGSAGPIHGRGLCSLCYVRDWREAHGNTAA